MHTNRTILHVDMDAFFASVEQRERPELRGRPVIVGAPADKRGVVAAASYEARAYGVRSAMPSRRAAALCPHAVFLPVNGALYAKVSRQIFRILERFTPLVEPVSIDEAFLDVTGARRLFGTGAEIAVRIKEAIRNETSLTASIGVAQNKFLAKLASDLCKPDGLMVMPSSPEKVMAVLAPLPASRLWGVGKVTEKQLARTGIHTIGDIQAASEQVLTGIMGRLGARHLKRLARGEDDREIELEYEEKSISREHTFLEDSRSIEKIRHTLDDLVDDVGQLLRASGKYAAVACLKLRWNDFTTISRQRPFVRPCCDNFTLRETAHALLDAVGINRPVRLIGFGVLNLRSKLDVQPDLFADGVAAVLARRERLSRAVDTIRQKHGDQSIRRAE
ncbi:MAG: DNA polymerase IV [Kiritimatiellia bacterium]